MDQCHTLNYTSKPRLKNVKPSKHSLEKKKKARQFRTRI